jgi:thiamine pyrophosphate-dependent acetolactate synthase large subunit-like protein
MKEFATCDVLSTITGRLIGNMGGIYEVLNYMTGESVFTHQLPRIGREATPVVVAAHPQLQQAIDEAEQVNQENWQQWRQTWEDRYGMTISVPQFTEATHERIDPISELAEHVHPDKIHVVGLGEG